MKEFEPEELRKWGEWHSCEDCKPLIEEHSKECGGFAMGDLCKEHSALRDCFGFFNETCVNNSFFERWKNGKENFGGKS